MAYPAAPTGLRVVDAGYMRSIVDQPLTWGVYLEVAWDTVGEPVEVKVYTGIRLIYLLEATVQTPQASVFLKPTQTLGYFKIEARRRYAGSGLGDPQTIFFLLGD